MTADVSRGMETLIDNAEASLRSNRFNPLGDETSQVRVEVNGWGGGCGPNARRSRHTWIWSCTFQSDSEGRAHLGELLRHRKLSFAGCDIGQAERATSGSGMRSVFHHCGTQRPELGLFRTFGGRMGVVPSSSPIPRVLRRQRWSPVNVLLVWVVVGEGRSTPVLDWMRVAERIHDPVDFCKGHIPLATQ